MEDVERQAIERALAATGGNRRRAATMLGIGLRTLYEKLKRYGL
jgi:two-component system response regulator FlrC